MASFPTGLKKERGQPSSPAASLTGARANTGLDPTVAAAAATTTTDRASMNAAVAGTSHLNQSPEKVLVTGTSRIGTGGLEGPVEGGSTTAAGAGGVAGARDKRVVGRGGRETKGGDGGALDPAQEAMRRMIEHIRTLDPYPCVLGIPVKPALFATSKVYVFGCFAVISVKLMYDVVSGIV